MGGMEEKGGAGAGVSGKGEERAAVRGEGEGLVVLVGADALEEVADLRTRGGRGQGFE